MLTRRRLAPLVDMLRQSGRLQPPKEVEEWPGEEVELFAFRCSRCHGTVRVRENAISGDIGPMGYAVGTCDSNGHADTREDSWMAILTGMNLETVGLEPDQDLDWDRAFAEVDVDAEPDWLIPDIMQRGELVDPVRCQWWP